MSTSAHSTVTDSRNSMDSTYDMGFGDSDDDNFSIENDYGDVSVVDYWFGKKYFECVAAQHLLHHQGFTGDMAAIDCRLTTKLQAYPYQQVLQRVSAKHDHARDPNGVSDSCHEFQALMTEIGWTIRTGTREMRARLLQILRQPLPRPTRVSSEPESGGTKRSAALPASELGQYASALNRYGQEHGFVTSYRYEASPDNSLTCVAVALCGEKTFRASGRNKRMARHAAAVEACEYFGVVI